MGELLKHGRIEESCSPFAAPVTMAYKKTGEGGKKEKTRMCIDFRELNKLLVPESTPFPIIDDIITKTRGLTWFSALDIRKLGLLVHSYSKKGPVQDWLRDSTGSLSVGLPPFRIKNESRDISENSIRNNKA